MGSAKTAKRETASLMCYTASQAAVVLTGDDGDVQYQPALCVGLGMALTFALGLVRVGSLADCVGLPQASTGTLALAFHEA